MKYFRCFRLLLLVILLGGSVFANSAYAYLDLKTDYTYDAAGNLSRINSNEQNVNLEYDGQGNLISRSSDSSFEGHFSLNEAETNSFVNNFSNVQGQNNWYYQEWDGTTYRNLEYENDHWKGSNPYTVVGHTSHHPAETDPVMKWVAPKAGFIKIAGNVSKSNPGGGDGVNVKVLKNNALIWSKDLVYNDVTGYEMNITVGVNAGDSIYFVLNKKGDNFYDGTNWTPVITYMKDSYAFMEGFSHVQGQNNWYYQEWDGTTYWNLEYENDHWKGSNPYTVVGRATHHPAETDPVMKWVAPKAGFIKIAGNVSKSNPGGGDGVNVKVLKNNALIWSKDLVYNDVTGYEMNITAGVNAGDAIYFVLNKKGDNFYDGTNWTPVITYMKDSYAFMEGFSHVQGQNNWYYQEWDGTTYRNLEYENDHWKGSNPYTVVGHTSHHPAETDPVMKWVAPKAGFIKIAGNVSKSNPGGGDGVNVKVLKNNALIWSKDLAYNDVTGFEMNITAGVNAGDAIYFVLNKKGDNFYDGTNWTPVIIYSNR
ncbi:hypothetical protein ACEU3E_32470 [Paenibacillus oleatilyticus]|uniref:Uncharacterized protein n=1 Tax=Paenibacillus oleatilyticus TaxID=2594886 RepID=A0ABV4VB63_9BACL